MSRPLRVLHCPSLIGGNPGQLARAERELGLDSRAVALTPSPYAFEADEILVPAGAGFARRESARLGLLWRALRWADIVHFNFGSTVMPRRADPANGLRASAWRAYAAMLDGRDLPLLRRAGKVIAMTYQGNDARQRDVSLARYGVTIAREVGPAYYPPGSDERKRIEIERIDRSADLIYALNPDLLAVLPERARFLSYANVDPAGIEPRPPNDPSAAPVVAHAPTHRGAKGTRFVLAALERLREEGVAFELRLIEGVGNREARELLSTSDLVVDQLLAGWYGGLANEAMAHGRAVVAYIRPGDLERVPAEQRKQLPVISATPDTIEPVLRDWLTSRRAELPEVGARGRAYVECWHDPRTVAASLKRDYERAAGARSRA